MQNSHDRFVVIISTLLTLLLLGGATLAVGFRNGWLRVATHDPGRDVVTAAAQLTDTPLTDAPPVLEAGADQSEGDRSFAEHEGDDERERGSRGLESRRD